MVSTCVSEGSRVAGPPNVPEGRSMPNVARPLNAAMESKGTIGKQLTFYGATCDREIYDECVVASLPCTTPGDFSAEVTNFSNREVASWLTSSGPVASLTINAQEFALSASSWGLGAHRKNGQLNSPKFTGSAFLHRHCSGLPGTWKL